MNSIEAPFQRLKNLLIPSESQPSIHWFAAVASGLLCYLFYFQNILNLDGMIYLHSANAFALDGLYAALHVFRWPFYSILMGSMMRYLHIPIEYVGIVFNILIYAGIGATFIKLTNELYGNTRYQRIALLLILIHPKLNMFRTEVLRDNPYWLCELLSLYYFLRYTKLQTWKLGGLWYLTTFLGGLFRTEGFVLIAMMPLCMLLITPLPFPTRCQQMLRLYTFNLLLIPVLFSIQHTGLIEAYTSNYVSVHNNFGMRGLRFVRLFANNLSVPFQTEGLYRGFPLWLAYIITFVAFISYLVARTIEYHHVIYLWFASYAIYYRQSFLSFNAQRFLLGNACIASLIIIVFFMTQFFVSGRYLMPLIWISFLLVPYGLGQMLENVSSERNHHLKQALIMLGLSYCLVRNWVSVGASSTYFREAGVWLKQHTAAKESIYFTDSSTAFYAAHPEVSARRTKSQQALTELLAHELDHYDWLEIHFDHKEKELQQQFIAHLGREPVAQFRNNKKDCIMVFKLS